MLSPTPRVDVLIPAFNVGSTVVEAVESMLKQSYRNIRVVVVDDGSTDDTAAKLRKLADNDARLFVHHQANGGIVNALNNGLEFCSGEFVARHDADDIAFPDRLEKQLAYLDANPDCVAVSANALHIDETGKRTGGKTWFGDPAHSDPNRVPADEPYLMHPLLLVRRQSLVDAGGYRYVFHAEDADLYWRLRSVGRLHNLDDLLADYRIHPNSVSGKSVVNGRVQALFSQLAALSERRRMRGAVDLEFPQAALERYHAARSMDGMMTVAEEAILPEELPQFRLAVAAKLLELESYRPYDLDAADRAFVQRVFSSYADRMTARDLVVINKRRAKYVAALVRSRDLRGAAQMFSPALVSPFASLLFNFGMRRAFGSWKG